MRLGPFEQIALPALEILAQELRACGLALDPVADKADGSACRPELCGIDEVRSVAGRGQRMGRMARSQRANFEMRAAPLQVVGRDGDAQLGALTCEWMGPFKVVGDRLARRHENEW